MFDLRIFKFNKAELDAFNLFVCFYDYFFFQSVRTTDRLDFMNEGQFMIFFLKTFFL